VLPRVALLLLQFLSLSFWNLFSFSLTF
jgi:hypothetical protein